MDTSEQYILMCELAKEIQKRWDECDDYDIIYYESHGQVPVIEVYTPHQTYEYLETNLDDMSKFVWLPRQDQLQDMFKPTNEEAEEMLKRMNYTWSPLSEFCTIEMFSRLGYRRYGNPTPLKVDTFEKLWLCHVMVEKYKKVWNGKEWVRV